IPEHLKDGRYLRVLVSRHSKRNKNNTFTNRAFHTLKRFITQRPEDNDPADHPRESEYHIPINDFTDPDVQLSPHSATHIINQLLSDAVRKADNPVYSPLRAVNELKEQKIKLHIGVREFISQPDSATNQDTSQSETSPHSSSATSNELVHLDDISPPFEDPYLQ